MKMINKRLFCLLIVFGLLVGMLPFQNKIIYALEDDAIKQDILSDNEPACSIGETQYDSLDDALEAVTTGDTIQLLKDIQHNKMITVDGKNIIFDLNGFTLNVTSSDPTEIAALYLSNNGVVALEGSGELNVTITSIQYHGQAFAGVYASSGSKVTVTNATATTGIGNGSYACGNSQIKVLGEVKSTGAGGVGALATGESEITIDGNVEGVRLAGEINNATIYVGGNATAIANDSRGVSARNGGTIEVLGNAQGHGMGAEAMGGSKIKVGGDSISTSVGGIGAHAGDGGTIIIEGNADGGNRGAKAEDEGSSITVGGNVIARRLDGDGGHGAEVQQGNASITIEGIIVAPNFVKIGGVDRTIDDITEPTTKTGYYTYMYAGNNVVWVKEATSSHVGEIFIQKNEGVPFKYKILTEGADNNTVEVIWDNSYTKRSDFTVPHIVTNEGTIYTVTSIGYQAFYNCKVATRIIIPEGITNISESAFKDCGSLENFVIPSSVKKIGKGAFAYCGNLTSIIIPDGVKIIEDISFRSCGFTSIIIPEGVETIGAGAFDYCLALANITIAESVTSIGGAAFNQCVSLENIQIPDGVTSIKVETFKGCKSLTSIHIPEGIIDIGDAAFMGCESLYEIHIPDNVTSIGDSVFAGCKSLSDIKIPNGITNIGGYTFSGCQGLKEIIIPANVISVGRGAFDGCLILKKVTFLKQTPPTFESFTFKDTPPNKTVYVPNGSKSYYEPLTLEEEPLEGSTIIELKAPENPGQKDPAPKDPGPKDMAPEVPVSEDPNQVPTDKTVPVITTSLENKIVDKSNFSFTVSVRDNAGGKINLEVKLNEKIITAIDGFYSIVLMEGENIITIEATDLARNKAKMIYKIIYKVPEKLEKDIDLKGVYKDENTISKWAYDDIKRATQKGIVKGSNEKINPKANITRAEFTKIIVLILSLDTKADKSTNFIDVTEKDWFYSYINSAYKMGIIEGNGDRFNPKDNITREEMAAMIVRASGLKGRKAKITIKDMYKVSDWAKEYVETVVAYEMMVGNKVEFDPKAYVTREMSIVVGMRVLDYKNNLKKQSQVHHYGPW